MTKQKIDHFRMSGPRRVAPLVAGLLLLWLTACSGAGASDSPADQRAALEDGVSSSEDVDEPAAVEGRNDDGVPATHAAPGPDDPSIATDAEGSEKDEKRPTLRRFDFPYKDTVEVASSVAPECVRHGDTIELSVTALPEAAIAYQAVYSDNKSGAGAPFGEGYGGNDKGYADGSGHYTSTWVVAPHAPAGRARADVFVGFDGKWGYASARFGVADENGNCPTEWLEGGD